MNATEIKTRIVTILKTIFNMGSFMTYLKDMIKLPYAKIYLLVVAPVVFVLMLAVTFPYDMLIRRSIKKLEPMVVKSFIINEIDFSFFSDIYLKDILILTNGGSEISIRETDIDASLNPFRLFISKNLKFAIRINRFKFASESTKIDFNASSNLQLSFKNYSEFPRQGMIKLIFENAHVELKKLPLPEAAGGATLTLPPIRIKTMNINGLMNGRMISFQEARIMGQDLRGNITGTVAIDPLFVNSRLDLRISLDAESPALADYKLLLGAFTKNNAVVLPVRGTIANPSLSFDAGGADQVPNPLPGPGPTTRQPAPTRNPGPLPRPQGSPMRPGTPSNPSGPANEAPDAGDAR